MLSTRNLSLFGLASAVLASTAHSVTLGTYQNTTVEIGGYVKLDALFSDFSDGTPSMAAVWVATSA